MTALFTELTRSLFLAWGVAQTAFGLPGWLGKVLGSLPARTLGRWSYGIFLSHNFLFGLFRTQTFQIGPLSVHDSQALLATLATFLWSYACYELLEKPLRSQVRT